MRIDRKVKALLKQAGAHLKRSKKHLVFGTPGGKNIVLSHTPSDGNAVHAQIRDLKQHLNIPKDPPRMVKEKRSKPGRHGEERMRPAPPPNNALADQLRTIGITEAALREELAFAYSEAMRFQDLMFKALQIRPQIQPNETRIVVRKLRQIA